MIQSDPHDFQDLLRESDRLIRTNKVAPTAATVLKPKSLSSFLSSFSPRPNPNRQSCSPMDKLSHLKQKKWASMLTEQELIEVSNTIPKLSSEGLQSSTGSRKSGWNHKLAGIKPKMHLPALERLNADLTGRMQQQAPKPTVKKAPEKWIGIRLTEEVLDENDVGINEDVDVVAEKAVVEKKTAPNVSPSSESEELPTLDELRSTNSLPNLVINSSDEEEVHGSDVGIVNSEKVQSNIHDFFSMKNIVNSSENRKLKSKQKRERRFKSTFLDVEAEESDSDGSADNGDHSTEENDTKPVKRKKKTIDSEEELDEDEIRKELIASKFIIEQGDEDELPDETLDINNVHNRLEIVRDAAALQAVVDRFARDKLDPKSRHITKLANKYVQSDRAEDDLPILNQTPHSDDSDHLGDLIFSDSDMMSESVSDNVSDFEESLLENANVNFAGDDIAYAEDDRPAANMPSLKKKMLSIDYALLHKLDPITQQKNQTKSAGFTVGNSIVAD